MSETTGQTGELSSEQKLAAMGARESNTQTVEAIATTGHVVSAVGAAVTIGAGIMTATSVACFAAPIAAGLAGALAGAALVDYLALDEKLLDFMGLEKIAGEGPQPATLGLEIAHGSPFAGALCGLLAGVAVGALCALAVGTGGLAVAVLAGAAAGLGGGFTAALVNGVLSKQATVTGKIVTGSPDVFFEGKPVARVTDKVSCSKHSGTPQIAEGSETIFVNKLPLARIGHKTTCGATIQGGCETIIADATTGQYAPIDSEMSIGQQIIVSLVEVATCWNIARARNSKLGKILFGEPVDPSDGSYVDFRTDFEYPSVMPLRLTRCYTGRDKTEGLLGRKWICNWSQRLIYDAEDPVADFEAADGEILRFSLGRAPSFNARNLKAPYYHLTGSKSEARLFDSRTQQTLIFTTAAGRLAAMEDRNGNRIDFTYEDNRLKRVTHSDGVSFIIAANSEGHITNIADDAPTGPEPLVTYTYTPSGELTSVTGTHCGEFHYTYTPEGWINHWQDSGVTQATLAYDREGRVIATRTPDGMYNDRFAYDAAERKTEYHDATGSVTTHWFNANGQLIREKDGLGHITTHQIDALDRKLSTTDALGRTTTFTHDAHGNLTGETDWTGRSLKWTHDPYGQITRIHYPDGTKATRKYDQRGNLIEAKDPDGGKWQFSHDDRGRLISEIAPDGGARRFSYDRRGRLNALRDTLGQTSGYYHDRWGRLQAFTNPEGASTYYRYEPTPANPRINLSRIIHPDGGEETFSYDREGLLSSHKAPEGQTTQWRHGAFDLLQSVTDPKGCVTKLAYDKAARLTQITNAQGQTWKFAYDWAGRLTAETDWSGRQTGYDRDALGRVIVKSLPGGIEQKITWDDLDRISAVETGRRRITYEYDPSDRLTRAATWTQETLETDLRYNYDKKGRLIQEIQNGVAIGYKYDTGGRLISRVSPAGKTDYAFDMQGRFRELQTNGHTLSIGRNALGLETERKYTPAAPQRNAFMLRQIYDPCGRLWLQKAGQGQSGSWHDWQADVSRKYTWDKSSRLIGIRDNKRGPTSYLHDPRDQISQITRIAGLQQNTEERHYQYDALMNLINNNGQDQTSENGLVKTAGPNSYRYDNRGRVIEKKQYKAGFRPRSWRYHWDDFDRMTQTQTPEGAVWKYTCDAFGRRVKKECVTPGKTGVKTAITYIWQGATLAEEWRTDRKGDQEQHIPFPQGTPGESSYLPFPKGEAGGDFNKDAPEASSHHPYLQETQSDSIHLPFPKGEAGGDFKTQITRWHFEPGTFHPLAKEEIKENEEGAATNFYPIVTDHMGTPKELFDTEGNCVWHADHDLWGEAKSVWRQKKEIPEQYRFVPLVDCHLRFQNQWLDEETGLHYNLNRYYDPDSGQYLTTDPIGLEGGLRTHAYVHNPMQWVDPLGLAGCPIWDAKASRWRDSATGKFAKPVSVSTPHGPAIQSNSIEARSALQQIQNGTPIYRSGKLGYQNTSDAQYWSMQNPATTPDYAGKMGMPSGGTGDTWIMQGKIKPDANIITREAPGIGSNIGGDIEAVTDAGSVNIDWYHMP